MSQPSSTFCIAPFVHMYIHSNEGSRICCMTTEPSEITGDTEMNLKDRWQGPKIQEIRKQFLNNERPEICSKCFSLEDNGGQSDRNRFNELYKDMDFDFDLVSGTQYKSPLDLDIRPGNLCNLKCRMCGPISSSQIQKEIRKNPQLEIMYGNGIFDTTDVLQSDKNIEFLLSNADKGRRIKFLGGEPTIMPEVDKFLDILISNGMTNVPLHFTTNCTNNKKSFIDKLSKFSAISFNYSIDGTHKVVEYIREPVKFSTINENIKIYHDIATSGQITYTYQAYNFFNLIDTIRWSTDLGISLRPEVLLRPDWCSIRVIPVEIRHRHAEMILKTNEMDKDINKRLIIPVINKILNDTIQYDPTNFCDYTQRLDSIRGTSIKESIPEVWEVMKGYFNG